MATTIKFELGGDLLTLTRNINYTVNKPTRSAQVLDRTAAGGLKVQTLGSAVELKLLTFTCLTAADIAGLIDWRDNISEWAANSFTYYDEVGDTHTVRWVDDTVDFPQETLLKFSTNITFEVVA